MTLYSRLRLSVAVNRHLCYTTRNGSFGWPVATSVAAPEQLGMLPVPAPNTPARGKTCQACSFVWCNNGSFGNMGRTDPLGVNVASVMINVEEGQSMGWRLMASGAGMRSG